MNIHLQPTKLNLYHFCRWWHTYLVTSHDFPKKIVWGTEQERAFQDLKEALTKEALTITVLIPYRPERDTMVMCDCSPEGLAGALFQKTTDGYKPVHYVSRTLTETEKRHSHIEREALAAEFSTRRLSMYLVGAPKFKLATDHKPLIPVMKNPNATIPPRIERIVMKMQNVDYEVIHVPGNTNRLFIKTSSTNDRERPPGEACICSG